MNSGPHLSWRSSWPRLSSSRISLLWLTSLILRNHLDLLTSVRLLGYTLPTVSGLTLPIAFLIGCTLTFNRLSMDSEYVVFASGWDQFGPDARAPGRGGCGGLWSVQFCAHVCLALGISGACNVSSLKSPAVAPTIICKRVQFNDAFKGLVLYVERTMPEQATVRGCLYR